MLPLAVHPDTASPSVPIPRSRFSFIAFCAPLVLRVARGGSGGSVGLQLVEDVVLHRDIFTPP